MKSHAYKLSELLVVIVLVVPLAPSAVFSRSLSATVRNLNERLAC